MASETFKQKYPPPLKWSTKGILHRSGPGLFTGLTTYHPLSGQKKSKSCFLRKSYQFSSPKATAIGDIHMNTS